jgi:hypothetical protein
VELNSARLEFNVAEDFQSRHEVRKLHRQPSKPINLPRRFVDEQRFGCGSA